MKFYKVVARPTVLYGSETWVTAERDMTRLEAAEMRFLRSVKRYTRLDKIRSEVIRKELKIAGIQDVKSKSKQNWINHLERMDNTDFRNMPSTTNLEGEEIVEAPGKDGKVSMPEKVKRPNPWMVMMTSATNIVLCQTVSSASLLNSSVLCQ
jgi:hypothetical protein